MLWDDRRHLFISAETVVGERTGLASDSLNHLRRVSNLLGGVLERRAGGLQIS